MERVEGARTLLRFAEEERLDVRARLRLFVAGDRLTYRVNGVVVNRATDVSPAQGKILLQTEGAEMFVRKFELRPLPKELP